MPGTDGRCLRGSSEESLARAKGFTGRKKSSGLRRRGDDRWANTRGEDLTARPAGWWRRNCQLQPSTCRCGPGPGASFAGVQDNKCNRDRSKSPPACLTSALQAPGNKVSGRWPPQRSREAGQSSRPRLRCCHRLPGRGGETSRSPRAGKKPRAGASRPSPPRPQPCHRDPQPGLTATPNRLPSRPPIGSGTPNSGRHARARRPPLPALWPPLTRLPPHRENPESTPLTPPPPPPQIPHPPAPSGNPGNRVHHPLPPPRPAPRLAPALAHLPASRVPSPAPRR